MVYKDQDLTWTKVRQLASYGNNTFQYGADGIRYKKNNTVYTLDGSKILQETDGTKIIKYYYGNGGVVGFNYNGADYFFEKNLQGDVIALLDKDGYFVAEYVYDAWGKILSMTDSTGNDISNNISHVGYLNPFRYRGYYYDVETDLYYLESRYYDPETGRFLNADSLSYLGEGSDLQNYNLYSYCENNPVMYSDPSGHSITISLLVGLGVSFAVGTGLSIVSQGFQYGWEKINYLQAGIDGLFALVSTALAYTGISMGTSIALGASMSFGQYAIGTALHGEELTWSGSLIAMGLGALGGKISGRGAFHYNSIGSNLDDVGQKGVKAILTAYDRYGYGLGFEKTLRLWDKRVSTSIAKSVSQSFSESAVKIWEWTAASAGISCVVSFFDFGF